MNEFDKELTGILDDFGPSGELYGVYTEQVKEKIKQAIEKAGYHKECPPKVTDGTLYPLIWAKANGYMTGQEWYDKFIKEVDHTPIEWPAHSTPEYIVAMVGIAYMSAAKKASGIEK